jgi:DNA-binding transcriptional LysR family regulator
MLRSMQWDDVRIFLAVAGTGSLSAAAKRVGCSVPTATRRISALERALGLRLVVRSPRGVTLTEDGCRIQALAGNSAASFAEVELFAAARRAPGGAQPVRVSATEPVVTEILAPALPQLWARHPELRVRLRSTTTVESLTLGEADIAVRLARPGGDSLIARRLPSITFGLYASRGYLGRRSPAGIDLRRERLLGFDDSYGPIAEVRWFESAGLADALALRTGSTRALLRACAAGAGIALLPVHVASREPGLLALHPPSPTPVRHVWLVWPAALRSAAAVGAVREWITASFAHWSA